MSERMQRGLMEWQAQILKGLGHPTRVRIIETLRGGERCVCEIMDELALEQSNVSQHLAVLKKLDILASRKDGLKMMYRVRHPQVFIILDLLKAMIAARARETLAVLKEAGGK